MLWYFLDHVPFYYGNYWSIYDFITVDVIENNSGVDDFVVVNNVLIVLHGRTYNFPL